MTRKHVVAHHAPRPRHHVGGNVALSMADVQPLPGRVREHVEHVVFWGGPVRWGR